MVLWAEMHVLQIDIDCPFEHFGDPQLTKPDSEKGGQKANPKWHHLTRRIDRDCGWCDDCDRWQSLTMQIGARDPTPRESVTYGIVSHTFILGYYYTHWESITHTQQWYIQWVVQSHNIPIFSMPSTITCKNAYNVHAQSNLIQYHTEYYGATTNVYCVHYVCLRYRSLLWDIAPMALCATTIQCRTQKCGTTHSLVWEAPSPLIWHNGLGTWDGLANVEITLKWKHSAAGKTIQQQRQPSWDLNWRRLADNRSRLESWW